MLADDGRQVTLEVLGPGKLFGQASYFGRVPRPTSAMAETDLEMLEIDYERLLPHLMADSALVREMFDLMGYSIRQLTVQISSLAFSTAEEQVIWALLQLKSEDDCGTKQVRYTHQELADTVGLNRVTVTKVLKSLAGKGWIRTGRGCIELLKESALERALTISRGGQYAT